MDECIAHGTSSKLGLADLFLLGGMTAECYIYMMVQVHLELCKFRKES